jgi:hypothetical protein
METAAKRQAVGEGFDEEFGGSRVSIDWWATGGEIAFDGQVFGGMMNEIEKSVLQRADGAQMPMPMPMPIQTVMGEFSNVDMDATALDSVSGIYQDAIAGYSQALQLGGEVGDSLFVPVGGASSLWYERNEEPSWDGGLLDGILPFPGMGDGMTASTEVQYDILTDKPKLEAASLDIASESNCNYLKQSEVLDGTLSFTIDEDNSIRTPVGETVQDEEVKNHMNPNDYDERHSQPAESPTSQSSDASEGEIDCDACFGVVSCRDNIPRYEWESF